MTTHEFRIAFSQAVTEDDFPLCDTGSAYCADLSNAGLTHLTDIAEATAEPLFDKIAELEVRLAEAEGFQKTHEDAQALFATVMREITETAEQALGYDQICSAPQAVRRLAERYQEAKAALKQYANDRRQNDRRRVDA